MTRGRVAVGDILLPLLVIAVVGMMIFPLPLAVLDVLLMFNIALSLSLLVSAMYLSEPERFTVLPSLLLISTLFRLALNISTTRQLLGRGEAPEIVVAFGEFVVQGNLLVGIVVFLILTVVQFLVIAKGGERVAEVAARFTLDAMPGKQMSIDADVRAGLLTLTEARERRRDLQRESKLYGALDGAMKFVKGDAIAGLIIIAINILAGLFVGVSQLGLSLSEAAHRYTVFTVGDGLVSQIPALLVAVAAAICVTRVSDKEGAFMGREMFSQLGREPQAIMTTAVLLMILAAAPGLPTLPFIALGVVLLTLVSRRKRVEREREQRVESMRFQPRVLSSLTLSLSPEATRRLQVEGELPPLLRDYRMEVFHRTGVFIPEIQYELNLNTPGCRARLLLKGRRISEVAGGDSTVSYSRRCFEEVARGIDRHLIELIDDGHTRALFDIHQAVAEDLVNTVVPAIVSVTALTAILRELVREGVSIRELRTILQAIAECGLDGEGIGPLRSPGGASSSTKRRELPEMLAAVRCALASVITEGIMGPGGEVEALALEPGLEQLLEKVAAARMPLNPDLEERIVAAVCHLAGEQRLESNACASLALSRVVLVSGGIRLFVSRLLRAHGVTLPVVAYDEITTGVKIRLVDMVGIGQPNMGGVGEGNVVPLVQKAA